ncbi:S8 family serine peptidase [Leptolyngbya cf. ectocarpi LEGE 11479]|uniref:S8 family serine peptidase n=1 Tax=Leptolyngbya cf. ectocarpi LEGE 11479 TaxID=1828722 RepID=A0A928X349_LEPEC|nr:S8 family serine peptidase [Leptolyngbya ectocarpi]MBE9066481.1 S8 family serine peptidase [Leptolyngbya cf. ectocarpi LEGE 11479]
MSSNTNQGSVVSQGDQALRADIARSTFSLNGDGITVGVISDSFNALGGFNDDVASGDLPSDLTIVQDDQSGTDEGRAMAQLVYDIAPGASLLFHAGGADGAAFAAGINALVAAGADVIVDDLSYYDEPWFQDGVVAQAAEAAIASGVTYLSSSGNEADQSYDSVFRGVTDPLNTDYLWHDFDPGTGTDILQEFTLEDGESIEVNFQWDQPFASAGGAPTANDMDVFLYDASGSLILASSEDNNIGGNAYEIVDFTNNTGSTATYNLAFGQFIPAGGPSVGRVKYLDTAGGTRDGEFFMPASTTISNANAEGVLTVGAAFYQDTPAFGQTPPLPEDSTSLGGTPILFDTAGNRLATPIVRDAPDFTSVDGTNTTFFAPGEDPENDGFNNFFGTSAAAPHAAGVVALMLQAKPDATPAEIEAALEATAIDMLTPGFDRLTGAGFIQADAAISNLLGVTDGSDIFVDDDNIVRGKAFQANQTYTGELFSNSDGTNSPDDTIRGTSGDDNIWAGETGNDIVNGNGGNDLIGIGTGDSTVTTDSGDDFVYSVNGGGGTNVLDLGDGVNTVYVEQGDYDITTGSGDDSIGLGTGTDIVRAGDGANIIYMNDTRPMTGDGDKDILTGSGDDYVQTGSGDDLIDGGSGLNTLFGGDGADTFIFRSGAYNFVGDFTIGSDTLELDSLAFGDLSFFQGQGDNAADAFIFVGSESIGQVSNITVADLNNSANFS